MHQKFTESQIKMLVHRAERRLLQIVADAEAADASSRHIARTSHHAFHETVVGLVTLFRDDMAGAADVATRIAREYANGVDAKAGAPTLACVRAILAITRHAVEHRLQGAASTGGAATQPSLR